MPAPLYPDTPKMFGVVPLAKPYLPVAAPSVPSVPFNANGYRHLGPRGVRCPNSDGSVFSFTPATACDPLFREQGKH